MRSHIITRWMCVIAIAVASMSLSSCQRAKSINNLKLSVAASKQTCPYHYPDGSVLDNISIAGDTVVCEISFPASQEFNVEILKQNKELFKKKIIANLVRSKDSHQIVVDVLGAEFNIAYIHTEKGTNNKNSVKTCITTAELRQAYQNKPTAVQVVKYNVELSNAALPIMLHGDGIDLSYDAICVEGDNAVFYYTFQTEIDFSAFRKNKDKVKDDIKSNSKTDKFLYDVAMANMGIVCRYKDIKGRDSVDVEFTNNELCVLCNVVTTE